MLKHVIAVAALGLAVYASSSGANTAEARARAGGGVGSFAAHAGAGFASAGARFSVGARSNFASARVAAVNARPAAFISGSRHRHRHFPFVAGFVSAPLVYGYVAYADSCTWLRERALETGSRKWWQRYYDCRDDD